MSAPTCDELKFTITTPEEREWCAQLMASSDPWKTLGRSLAECQERCSRIGYDLVIAHRGIDPCGFALLHPLGVAGSPYIASIATVPEIRGKGIGSALLGYCERFYPEARHIFLCVSSFNTRARALYARQGYTIVGELKDYVIAGASEILMCKRLVQP